MIQQKFTPQQREQRMARYKRNEIEHMLSLAWSAAKSSDPDSPKIWMKRERHQMLDTIAKTKELLGLNDLSEVLDENGNIKPGVLR